MTGGAAAQPAPGGGAEPRFTAEQASRALQRAVTMKAQRTGADGIDMSLEELVEMGRDIGLSEQDVRSAAAMERFTDTPDSGRRLARMAGPPVATQQEVVDAAAGDVTELLEEWVRVAHCMKVRTRDEDAAHWEPAGGLAGSLLRGARSIAGEPVLDGVKGMKTQVAEVGDGRSVVRVELDPGARNQALAQALGTGGVLVVAGLVVAVASTPLGLLLVPVGIATAGGIVTRRRRRMDAAQREIARLMSGVAHGERPPTALDAMRGRVRKAR